MHFLTYYINKVRRRLSARVDTKGGHSKHCL